MPRTSALQTNARGPLLALSTLALAMTAFLLPTSAKGQSADDRGDRYARASAYPTAPVAGGYAAAAAQRRRAMRPASLSPAHSNAAARTSPQARQRGAAPVAYQAEAEEMLQPEPYYEGPVLMDGGDGGYPGGVGGSYCPPRASVYGQVEALLWWTSGDQVPPLVTTAPVGTPVAQAGALNAPNTTILFGDQGLSDALRGGVRFTLGVNLGPCWAIEGGYFGLGQTSDAFARNSTQTPILARPFLNINGAIDDHQRIAFQGAEGEIDGAIRVVHESTFQGAELLSRMALVEYGGGCGSARLQLLGGYRYLILDETLSFRSGSTVVDDPGNVLVPGTQFDVRESFGATNTFNGGDIGLAASFQGAWVTLDLTGRLAIGNSHEVVIIRGSNTTTVPGGGAPVTEAGGLLAQPTNIGRYERDELAFVPHLAADLHFNLTNCWRLSVGYDFLFWSSVARPGEQIDLAINPSQFNGGQLAGAPRPEFAFNDGSFWAHGLSLGVDCRY